MTKREAAIRQDQRNDPTMTDTKETRESEPREGCATSDAVSHPDAGSHTEAATWLYVSTSLDMLLLPNCGRWRLQAIYSRPTLSSRPTAYYRLTADVYAWLVARISALDAKAGPPAAPADPKLAAGLRELAPAFDEVMAWVYANLPPGELAVALAKPERELKLPAVEKMEMEFDGIDQSNVNASEVSKQNDKKREPCEGETENGSQQRRTAEPVWRPAARQPRYAEAKAKGKPKSTAEAGGMF